MSSIGTELKINLHIEPLDGWRMKDYDFHAEFFIYANRVEKVDKSAMIESDPDNYVALVDTARLGTGEIRVRLTAYIPDNDFPDGLRTEVVNMPTGITITK